MQKIVNGVQQFKNEVFKSKQSLFEELVAGQHPEALFITCSDSRISPNLLTQTDPGELFILRNAGNIVPPYGSIDGGEAATIEYAVNVLQVGHIIVCGHSHCGAMGGLMDLSKLSELPAVRSWLDYALPTQKVMEEKFSHLTDPTERLRATVEQNVLVQIEQLKTHPSVAAALEKQSLNLHGWVYSFETGEVSGYQPEADQFSSIQ